MEEKGRGDLAGELKKQREVVKRGPTEPFPLPLSDGEATILQTAKELILDASIFHHYHVLLFSSSSWMLSLNFFN